jgi:chemotaxis protein histidine kinase CheA
MDRPGIACLATLTEFSGRATGRDVVSVYGNVRQMGGAVVVESKRDHGATFSVYLPAALQQGAQADTISIGGEA